MPQKQTAERLSLVETARGAWVSRLIDLSRRNNLLFFQASATNCISIPAENPVLADLLAGKPVSADLLFPEKEGRASRVLSLARKAQENSEEKGLQTLYLAAGFLKWPADDGGRDYACPAILFPVHMKQKGRDLTAIEVQVAGEPKLNPVLCHIFASDFDLRLHEEELLAPFLKDDHARDSKPGETALAYCRGVVENIALQAKRIEGLQSDPDAAISNFSFAKLALVNDLKAAGERLANNDVVAAIAGDNATRASLAGKQVSVDPGQLDRVGPDAEFCVVEADSSQQCAIAGIAAGQNAVVHGPPGTGKSQTITNLIATLVASGKTILFVAEKRAALEVVQNRLTAAGLGHLAIDLHGAESTPKRVMEQVTRTLNIVRQSKPVEAEVLHRQFSDRREKLNAHDQRMHAVSEQVGLSAFDLQGALLRLPTQAKTTVRWRGSELTLLTAVKADEIRDLFRDTVPFASLFLRVDPSAWTGLPMRTPEQTQKTMDRVQRLAFETLPQLLTQATDLARATGFDAPTTFAEFDADVAILRAVSVTLDRYSTGVFARDLTGTLTALERVKAGGPVALFLSWINSEVKAAKKTVLELRGSDSVGMPEAFRDLTAAVAHRQEWTVKSKGRTTPLRYADLSALEKTLLAAKREVEETQKALGQLGWERQLIGDIQANVDRFASDSTTPYRMMTLSRIEASLSAFGLQRLVDDLRQRAVLPELWPTTFDFAWLTSALDDLALRLPELRSFVGESHSQYVEDFKRLDRNRLEVAKDRVRRKHAENAIRSMNAHGEQEALIRQEAARTRRFKPLRKVFEEASDVLTSVCPCWMASPLSVAQLIHPNVHFDYVIFDEASQILPEDAIPAIMRGTHVVVAGDNKQLPPTGFFSADVDTDDDSAATSYESLLDMMLPFACGFHLNWHYRSKDESLISFSNRYIYDGRLVTFPGVGGSPAVSHVFVNELPASDGEEHSSGAEVRRVVELVLRHAAESPNKTLGVIALGLPHAMRIQGALDLALAERSDLASFFDTGRADRFFVKNLERVQGDERDSIILSVGYGKDSAGNLKLRFGPILGPTGVRRLNVAVTRARESLTLVSSFADYDINAAAVKPGSGLEFLKNYLQYAGSAGRHFSKGSATDEPMNNFESDIYEALTARGLNLVSQVGCSSFRIDFGVCHPTEPGRFVLAIEADGATYHSSFTARDRDRLRQQTLENLGWTFHRIWSTDWFQRKNEEIDRAVAAYERAVARADAPPKLRIPEPPSSPEYVPDVPMQELSSRRSSVFPPIPKRANIGDYTAAELRALHAWVASDGQLRTHDEIADEMFAALPFARRGARIEAALQETIRRNEISRVV